MFVGLVQINIESSIAQYINYKKACSSETLQACTLYISLWIY